MKCYDCKNEAVEGQTRCNKHQKLSKERGKIWRSKNKEKNKKQKQQYYINNREEIKDKARKWAKGNKKRKAKTSKKWAENNPNRVLNSRMKRFGITANQYDELLKLQGNKCDICGSKEPGGRGRFNVDHDHEAELKGIMRVRGLLCVSCNRGIGYMRDNPSLMRKAAKYIEDYSNPF